MSSSVSYLWQQYLDASSCSFNSIIIIKYKIFFPCNLPVNVHWLWSQMHKKYTHSSFISRQHLPEPQSSIFKSDQSFESVAFSNSISFDFKQWWELKAEKNHVESHGNTSQTTSRCFWLTLSYSLKKSYSMCKFVIYCREATEEIHLYQLRQASMHFLFPVCAQRCYSTMDRIYANTSIQNHS